MLHRNVWLTLALMLVPVACVTINVYFPAAAAERAAEQFVDQVFGEMPIERKPTKPEPEPALTSSTSATTSPHTSHRLRSGKREEIRLCNSKAERRTAPPSRCWKRLESGGPSS